MKKTQDTKETHTRELAWGEGSMLRVWEQGENGSGLLVLSSSLKASSKRIKTLDCRKTPDDNVLLLNILFPPD